MKDIIFWQAKSEANQVENTALKQLCVRQFLIIIFCTESTLALFCTANGPVWKCERAEYLFIRPGSSNGGHKSSQRLS